MKEGVRIGKNLESIGFSDVVRQLDIAKVDQTEWTRAKAVRNFASAHINGVLFDINSEFAVSKLVPVNSRLEDSLSLNSGESFINWQFFWEHKLELAALF